MTHDLIVSKVWSPTPSVRAIRIAKPEGFAFEPGQWLSLSIRDQVRELSIASSPHRDHLELAARRSESEFKRAFFALKEGDTVRVSEPSGDFRFERDRPAIMLAADIGITPFRSMLQTIADEGLRPKLTLVYANIEPAEVAFGEELEEIVQKSGVRVLYTVSYARMKQRWPHRIGRIDRALIQEVLVPGAVLYAAGPPQFVEEVAAHARDLGVDERDFRAERFTGYSEDPTVRAMPSWEDLYRVERVEEMPWFYRELDPDVARALERHPIRGRALDVGTGPATQAIALAKLGFQVVGTDISSAAIELAQKLAAKEGVNVDFVQDDILDSKVPGTFDLILDRGCFHVLAPEQRPIYLRAISDRLVQGGLLFLKCFSIEQPGEQGPRRLRPSELEEIFGAEFEILSIDRTIYYGTLDPMPKALFAVMRKR